MGSSNFRPVVELNVGQRIGQCRATCVQQAPDAPLAFLVAYSADFDVDPYTEMFFLPTDTLKLMLFDENGRILWRKDLGKGVVPGMWFCPVLPFDLDGDGRDEIYFVNNIDPRHPLGHSSYRLQRLNSATGEETGQWKWPANGQWENLSHAFRNFLIGGHASHEPVLVTAQGTYGNMHLQGWNSGMTPRWTRDIPAGAPGARGGHVCPVVDIDGDGNDELMWGERCIDLSTGEEQFCADRESYRGHSDLVAPMFDHASGRWFIMTNRESDPAVKPRVVLFDDHGQRVWGAVDEGHMDMGWVARWDVGRLLTMSIRIGHKTCGPDGRFHTGMTEFVFDALTGQEIKLPFSTYQTLPVDVNGDGMHELVRGIPGGNGDVIDRQGAVIGNVQGTVAMCAKLLSGRDGEQILAHSEDGTLRIWADLNAADSPAALARYRDRYYTANRRMTSTGWNQVMLGGL